METDGGEELRSMVGLWFCYALQTAAVPSRWTPVAAGLTCRSWRCRSEVAVNAEQPLSTKFSTSSALVPALCPNRLSWQIQGLHYCERSSGYWQNGFTAALFFRGFCFPQEMWRTKIKLLAAVLRSEFRGFRGVLR